MKTVMNVVKVVALVMVVIVMINLLMCVAVVVCHESGIHTFCSEMGWSINGFYEGSIVHSMCGVKLFGHMFQIGTYDYPLHIAE